jgi:hypothetical protein
LTTGGFAPADAATGASPKRTTAAIATRRTSEVSHAVEADANPRFVTARSRRRARSPSGRRSRS